MWKEYEVTWKFLGKLCGSTPLNSEIINPWLEARKPTHRPPLSKSIEEITEEVMSSVVTQDDVNKETEERVTLGFQMNEGYLVMRGGTIKAHIKDCGRILSSLYIGKVEGQRSLSVRLINCVNVKDYWIPILRNEEPIKKSDGTFDKAVHVHTPRGDRNALKRIHYINQPTLKFKLQIMENTTGKPVISLEDMKSVFEYGGTHGYAGERGDGEGRYTFEIKEIKK